MQATCDRIDEAELTLAEQGMPPDEIRAVLGTNDPRIVHRYLELHRERLAERLDAERLAVDLVERVLVDEVGRPRVTASGGSAYPGDRSTAHVLHGADRGEDGDRHTDRSQIGSARHRHPPADGRSIAGEP